MTLGILIEESPFATGLTGYKWFRKLDKYGEKSWERYNYYDLQSISSESIILPGIGLELLKEIIYHLHQDLKFGVAGFSYRLTNILI